jgi:uncharacterized protein YoxC
MKEGTKSWIEWICGAIVIGGIIILIFYNFKRQKTIDQDAKDTKVMNDSIRTLNAKNNELTTKLNTCQSGQSSNVNALNDSINKLNAKNDELTTKLNTCQSSKKATVAKKQKNKKIVKVAPNDTKQTAKPEKPAKIETVEKVEEVEKAVITDKLDYLRDENEEIIACLRVNGSKDGHFPHYAKDRGAKISNAKDNGKHGYNYVLTPVESISGNVPGVTKDGTFFVPATYLKKYLNMSGESLKYVDILYKGNWGGIRMTLQGEYYILDSSKEN